MRLPYDGCLAQGLTQAVLAERCGVKPLTMARYETGRRIPSRRLEAIQRVTRLSFDALLHPQTYLEEPPQFLPEGIQPLLGIPGRPRRRLR
jgi:transcriptional regulator with XRE-family HTH domain